MEYDYLRSELDELKEYVFDKNEPISKLLENLARRLTQVEEVLRTHPIETLAVNPSVNSMSSTILNTIRLGFEMGNMTRLKLINGNDGKVSPTNDTIKILDIPTMYSTFFKLATILDTREAIYVYTGYVICVADTLPYVHRDEDSQPTRG